ncbi:right-handed parallel beta-helix repeat-containing protein, partial [Candidatus Woesearchaeota archaeon]|nr:right-handed parallel beta-helix repeat-containing protein [Candidatus Woesearchaeota archaeon]
MKNKTFFVLAAVFLIMSVSAMSVEITKNWMTLEPSTIGNDAQNKKVAVSVTPLESGVYAVDRTLFIDGERQPNFRVDNQYPSVTNNAKVRQQYTIMATPDKSLFFAGMGADVNLFLDVSGEFSAASLQSGIHSVSLRGFKLNENRIIWDRENPYVFSGQLTIGDAPPSLCQDNACDVNLACSDFSWQKVADSGQSWSISISDDSAVIFASADTGVWKSTNDGAAWSLVSGSISSEVLLSMAIDGMDENTVYLGSDKGIYVSTDQGTSFTQITSFPFSTEEKFLSLLTIPGAEGVLYAGLSQENQYGAGGIWKTEDFGESWEYVGLENANVTALSFSGMLYAAVQESSSNYGIYVYDFVWPVWQEFMDKGKVNDLRISKGRFVAALGNKVYTRVDADWVDSGFTGQNAVEALQDSSGKIIVGTSGQGVYVKNGNSWAQKNTGLGNLFIEKLALAKDGTLLAATRQGIYSTKCSSGQYTCIQNGGMCKTACNAESETQINSLTCETGVCCKPKSQECTPGQTDKQNCLCTGRRTRTCGSDGKWGAWSSCVGGGECAAGATDTVGCKTTPDKPANDGTKTRTCSSNCQWGDYSDCTPATGTGIVCGTTISKPGIYELSSDLQCNGNGINIVTSDVTLDCKNHLITYAGTDTTFNGINVMTSGSTLKNVIVKNCVVENYGKGINFQMVSNSAILNNVVRQSTLNGIQIFCGDNNRVFGNTVAGTTSYYGIHLNSNGCWNSHNDVISNTLNNNNNGIRLVKARYTDVSSNSGTGNKYGIYVYNVTPLTSTDNSGCNNNVVGTTNNCYRCTESNNFINVKKKDGTSCSSGSLSCSTGSGKACAGAQAAKCDADSPGAQWFNNPSGDQSCVSNRKCWCQCSTGQVWNGNACVVETRCAGPTIGTVNAGCLEDVPSNAIGNHLYGYCASPKICVKCNNAVWDGSNCVVATPTCPETPEGGICVASNLVNDIVYDVVLGKSCDVGKICAKCKASSPFVWNSAKTRCVCPSTSDCNGKVPGVSCGDNQVCSADCSCGGADSDCDNGKVWNGTACVYPCTGPTLNTQNAGCLESVPSNAIGNRLYGYCAPPKICVKCNTGVVWNGTNCAPVPACPIAGQVFYSGECVTPSACSSPDFCSASHIPNSIVSTLKTKNAWCDSRSGSGKKCYTCTDGTFLNGFPGENRACVNTACSGDAQCKDSQALQETLKYEAVYTSHCNGNPSNYVCMKCKSGYQWNGTNCVLSGPGQCPSGSTWNPTYSKCLYTCKSDGSTNCKYCLVDGAHILQVPYISLCRGDMCGGSGIEDGIYLHSLVYFYRDGVWKRTSSGARIGSYCFATYPEKNMCFLSDGVLITPGTIVTSHLLCVAKTDYEWYECNNEEWSNANNQVVSVGDKNFKCTCSGTTCSWSEVPCLSGYVWVESMKKCIPTSCRAAGGEGCTVKLGSGEIHKEDGDIWCGIGKCVDCDGAYIWVESQHNCVRVCSTGQVLYEGTCVTPSACSSPDFCSASAIPGSFVSRDKAKNAWCDSKSG